MTVPAGRGSAGRGSAPGPGVWRDGPSLLYLLKRLELAVTVELDQVTAIAGLTPVQYTVLTELERRPGVTAAQLARTSFVRAQSMGELLSALTGRGLIRREQDPKDRRHYLLFLTPEGQSLVSTLRRPVQNLERLMIAGLSPEEAATLGTLLSACQENLAGVTKPPAAASEPAAG